MGDAPLKDTLQISKLFNSRSLGTLYYQQGKLAPAESHISCALTIFQKILGNDHLNTQTVKGWLKTVQQAVVPQRKG